MDAIAILVSIGAVIISVISLIIARRSIVAPLVVSLLTEYASDDFLNAMLEIREFEKKSSAEGNNFSEVYKKEMDNESEVGNKIHKARRKIAHHFHLIARLINMNILNEKDVMKIVSKDQISFLIEVIKPLESQLNPQLNNHPTYRLFDEYFRKMSVDDKDWRKNMMW
ncbi:MAG: hypothetical protein AB1439_12345 [candidate division FCPU426 bacterium]